jgi:anti-sigma factor RsiW
MLSCDIVSRHLYDYVSEDLSAEYRDLIEAHLPKCPACRTLVDGYRAVIRLARELGAKPLPPGFLDNLLRMAKEHKPDVPR